MQLRARTHGAGRGEAFLVLEAFAGAGFEIVVPSESIQAEPPVALVDGNADARGTRAVAEAYLNFLYTPEGQALAAKHFYRPRHPEHAKREDLARFAELTQFTVDERFGGWRRRKQRTSRKAGCSISLSRQSVESWHADRAPELAQRCAGGPKALASCGKIVAEALKDKLAGQTIVCRGDERDKYGRLLARCRLGDQDLSTWLVEQGYGLAFRRYSTKLVATEEKARAEQRGLWQTVLEPPWAFRARRWAEAGSQAPGGCAIKGNVSRQGEKIYHTPWGDRFHERTRIDESKGGRWFYSEKEASDAGFRAPLLR